MVKIEILEESEHHVSLLLKETDRAFANAMRRTLMSNVPKMAIHRVRFELGTITDSQTGEVYESVGALPDEVIAHRLAMIPIPTFHDEFCFLKFAIVSVFIEQIFCRRVTRNLKSQDFARSAYLIQKLEESASHHILPQCNARLQESRFCLKSPPNQKLKKKALRHC